MGWWSPVGGFSWLGSILGSVWVAGALSLTACSPKAHDPIVSLDEFESVEEIGLPEGDGLAVLQDPRDVILTEDQVIVLDGASPWIRVFDRKGALLRAGVPDSQGRGEAREPFGLTQVDRGFLLWQATGILPVGNAASEAIAVPPRGYTVRGGLMCEAALLSLVLDFDSLDSPGLLVRLPEDRVIDTLVVLGPQRTQAFKHPFFTTRTEAGFLFYAEETTRDRLVEVDCEGTVLREIDLAPLGPPEQWEMSDGGWRARSAKPPHPAGLGSVENVILWATQELGDRPRSDGVGNRHTVITAYYPDGDLKRLAIAGWYQLLGDAPDGTLVLGKRASPARIVLLDGHELLQFLGGRIEKRH